MSLDVGRTAGGRVRTITLLLVDDSELFQFEVIRLIERSCAGAVEIIGTAKSGRMAIVEAQRLSPQVVLLDLNMPGLSGLETIPMLREVCDAGVIVVSVWDDEDRRSEAIAAGADDVVGKSRIVSDLLPAIERVAQQYSRRA